MLTKPLRVSSDLSLVTTNRNSLAVVKAQQLN